MENFDDEIKEISYNELSEMVQILGGTLETKEKLYRGENTPCTCICYQNHICRPYPYKIFELGKIPCPKCIEGPSVKARFYAYMKEIGAIRKKGSRFGDGRVGLPYICPLDHDCNPAPCNVMRGQGICDICANRSTKISGERYIACIKLQGAKFAPEQKYKNNRTPVDLICKENHLCRPIPANVMNGKQGVCRKCANQDPEDSENFFRHDITEIKKGKVIGVYINALTPVECLCCMGHTCYPMPNNIKKGQGMCETCRHLQTVSKGEKMTREAMEIIVKNDTKYTVDTQFRPEDLNLKYDVFLTKIEDDEKIEHIEMLIEFHGIQHEEEHKYYHKRLHGDKSTEVFLAARERDLAKIYYAAKNNYKLVVLDYKWVTKPIEEWVEYLKTALESDKLLIADSPMHNWVRNDKPSKETICKYKL